MSALSDLATTMVPGQWAQLSTVGMQLTSYPTPRSVFDESKGTGAYSQQYTDEFKWDFTRHIGFFAGAWHGNSLNPPSLGGDHPNNFQFARLPENTGGGYTTNTWKSCYGSSLGPSAILGASLNPCIGLPVNIVGDLDHGYGHQALDEARGEFIYKSLGGRDLYRFTIDTEVWDLMTSLPTSVAPSWNIAHAIEYFPELDSYYMLDGSWGLFRYNRGTNVWSKVTSPTVNSVGGLGGLGGYQMFMAFDRVNRAIYMGGNGSGSEPGATGKTLWKLDSSGVLTRMADAPIGLGTQFAMWTEDPNTGRMVVLHKAIPSLNDVPGIGMKEYNTLTDTWTTLGESLWPPFTWISNGEVDTVVGSPCEYGVQMYLKYKSTVVNPPDPVITSEVWLYKHSPAAAPPPTPSLALIRA